MAFPSAYAKQVPGSSRGPSPREVPSAAVAAASPPRHPGAAASPCRGACPPGGGPSPGAPGAACPSPAERRPLAAVAGAHAGNGQRAAVAAPTRPFLQHFSPRPALCYVLKKGNFSVPAVEPTSPRHGAGSLRRPVPGRRSPPRPGARHRERAGSLRHTLSPRFRTTLQTRLSAHGPGPQRTRALSSLHQQPRVCFRGVLGFFFS